MSDSARKVRREDAYAMRFVDWLRNTLAADGAAPEPERMPAERRAYYERLLAMAEDPNYPHPPAPEGITRT